VPDTAPTIPQAEPPPLIDPDSASARAELAEATERDEAQVGQPIVPRAPTLSLMDRAEALIARLSARNHFWHRVCSLIWLPYAFKSGIRMKKVEENTFTAELPFRRFNRNWYNAMAGAALLANSEIAGGMYIFARTGGDYSIVCKKLSYDFLRPCFGPALYRVKPLGDLDTLLASGAEFNITLELDIIQQALLPAAVAKNRKKDELLARLAAKERRVGKCTATFHLTPTSHNRAKHGHSRAVGKGSDYAARS